MTKDQFVSSVAEKAGLSRADAAKAVDAFLASLTDALASRDELAFAEFGTLATRRHAAWADDLDRKAHALRVEAEDLQRSHRLFQGRIEKSLQTLREIAEST